jgi:hypothetical protein
MARSGGSRGRLHAAASRAFDHPVVVAAIALTMLVPSAVTLGVWTVQGAPSDGGTAAGATADEDVTVEDPVVGEIEAPADALSPPDEAVERQVELGPDTPQAPAPETAPRPELGPVEVALAPEVDAVAPPSPVDADVQPDDAELGSADASGGDGTERTRDGVPERWVVGSVTLEDEQRRLGERVRVLAGSTLVLANTTLTFEGHPEGPTGLVAEPGSRVVLEDAALQAAENGTAPYRVHLEGEAVARGAELVDAQRVVVQPRPASDHVEDALPEGFDDRVPGRTGLRAFTNATAELADVTVDAQGPGLVLGVPTPRDSALGEADAGLRLHDVRVDADQGPGLLCYRTHADEDADEQDPAHPALGEATPADLTLADADVTARDGPGLVCPEDPQADLAPARSAPTGTLAPAGTPTLPEEPLLTAGSAIPGAPASYAHQGPARLALDGGHVTAAGPAVAVPWGQTVALDGTAVEGAASALALAAPDAKATLADVTGNQLERGVVAADGTVRLEGGHLAGAGTGLAVDGATVEADGTELTGFDVGLAADRGTVTLDRATLDRGAPGPGPALATAGTALEARQLAARDYATALAAQGGAVQLDGARLDGTGSGTALGLDEARLEAADVRATGFATGLAAEAATASLEGSQLGGADAGTGISAATSEVTLDGVTLDRFASGLAIDRGTLTAWDATVRGDGLGGPALALDGAQATVEGLEATGHRQGIALDGATAEVTDATLTGPDDGHRAVLATDGDLALDRATVEGYRDGLHLDGGTLEARSVTLTGPGGDGLGVALDGTEATLASADVTGYRDAVRAAGPLTVEDTELAADRVCLAAVQVAVEADGVDAEACTVGVLLDRSTGSTLASSTFADVADPLQVRSPDTERDHFDHEVRDTTAEGEPVELVFDAADATVDEPADLVVAFSERVDAHDIDPRPARWTVAASTNVTLGTYTDDQDRLAATFGEDLAELVATAHETVNFEPYPGAMKGPNATVEQRAGNDLDQAWAVLDRAEELGLEARFVDGTITMEHAAFLNWTRMDDLDTALTIPGFSGTVGPSEIELDHTWTEVRVAEGTWLSVDPAFEQYRPNPSPDWVNETVLSTDDHYDRYMEQVTTGDGWAKDIPVEMLDANHSQGQAEFQQLIDPDEDSFADVFGGHQPRPVDRGDEPDHEPEDRFQLMPLDRQWSVDIETFEPGTQTQGEIDVSGTLPDVYQDELTLTGRPTSTEDLDKVVENGSVYNMSRKDVEFSTVLWQDERPVDVDGKWETGPDSAEVRPDHSADRHPGDPLRVSVEVERPGGDTAYEKTSPIRVGGTYSIVLSAGRMSAERPYEAGQQLQEELDAATSGEATSVREVLGSFHRAAGTMYFSQAGFASAKLAQQMGVQDQPLVSTAVAGNALQPVLDDGRQEVRMAPPSIDVQGLENAFHRDGNETRTWGYNFGAGLFSSLYEDHVKTQLYEIPAISTVKGLNLAALNDERIYQLDSSNAADKLDELDHPREVKQSIVNAVNRGDQVIVPQSQTSYFNWTGSVWAEVDQDTGQTGWLIRGGVSLGEDVQRLGNTTALEGGAGAQRTPLDDLVNLVDRGYGYIPAPGWTSTGLGAISTMAEGVPTVYSDLDGKWFTHQNGLKWYNLEDGLHEKALRMNWNGGIELRNADEIAERGLKFTDDVPPGLTKAGKAAGPIGTAISFYSDFHQVALQPDDDRTVTERVTDPAVATELGARWAWNLGSMSIESSAAAGGAMAGAAACSAAPVLGTTVCGVGGAVVGGVGAGYVSGRAKEWAIDEGKDLVGGLF